MLPRRLPLVNAALLCTTLLSCSPDAPAADDRSPSAHPLHGTRAAMAQGLGVPNGIAEAIARGHLPGDIGALHLSEFQRPPPPPSASVLSGLGPDLTRLEVDMDLGQELADYVDENVPRTRWTRNGVMSLTYDEIFGTTGEDGLCQPGALLDSFDQDGTSYEASYSMGLFAAFIDGPETVLEDISDACVAALLSAGDDPGAAVGGDCDDYDEHTFFPEGSDCRACLEEEGGDFLACADQDRCQEEAPSTSWVSDYATGEKTWFNTALGYVWACAPDLPAPMYVLGNFQPDGSLPQPFDHEAYAYFCFGTWDESIDDVAFSCSDGTGGWQYGHTLGEGAIDRVNYIRPEGSGELTHYDRVWYAHSMSIKNGPLIEYFWATTPGVGQISMPTGDLRSQDPQLTLNSDPTGSRVYGAWDFNPYALRPDGTDPDQLDDLLAREWLATITLKTATTIDGIFIYTYNHNRCAADGWVGPLADGSYRCDDPGPLNIGWHDDLASSYSADLRVPGSPDEGFVQTDAFPMATLGSTGLPDPEVPGGATVQIAGTAALADDDWDGCSWPTTFVPDHAPYESVPGEPDQGRWLWGDTWRFGAHPELDLRVVLNTNQERGFRPEEPGYAEERLGQ